MQKFVKQRYFPRSGDKFYIKYNFYNLNHLVCLFRNSHLQVFCQRAVFKNFAKFLGKGLWWNLFFNKVAGFHPATLFKKRLQHEHKFYEFYDIVKNSCSYRTSPVAASVYFLSLIFSTADTLSVKKSRLKKNW